MLPVLISKVDLSFVIWKRRIKNCMRLLFKNMLKYREASIFVVRCFFVHKSQTIFLSGTRNGWRREAQTSIFRSHILQKILTPFEWKKLTKSRKSIQGKSSERNVKDKQIFDWRGDNTGAEIDQKLGEKIGWESIFLHFDAAKKDKLQDALIQNYFDWKFLRQSFRTKGWWWGQQLTVIFEEICEVLNKILHMIVGALMHAVIDVIKLNNKTNWKLLSITE